ncbi:hypothetical protein [Luteibacter sp. UNCMF366Tsu5.1]|uniref:hypothetical protein n=1 Tax=Luteibacter sp. UNCMF366Tsu5.1 TaxID=1502758 RepID=UPI000908F1EB|nr:hypothetical protein [Luteibacter sp. UNCMF366Tsu5.1]SFW59939.1 hypothetical protein SAMN02800691_2449 [Luteibacter sp. UNCMF366Tsu5.1]
MSQPAAGYLIHFDEERRNNFLQEVQDLADGFSDALSSDDWPIRQWEVCGLLFSPGVISHWALARKGKRVATGKVRVEFTEIVPANIQIADVVQRVGRSVKQNIISSRSGSGGAVPVGTWKALKEAVGQIDADALQALERLERLRDQSRERIDRPGTEVVAQQRDAVGLALDVFDRTGKLRKGSLQGWTAPEGAGLTSFLNGLEGVHTIEDQLIARDASLFPDSDAVRPTVVGTVFSVGGRKLEVFNVNRTAVERALGVDLLYFHEEFDAWTMVQYKSMERGNDASEHSAVYRPDARFDAELARMDAFRKLTADQWVVADGMNAYRLSGDGFFFKLCSRVQLEVLSEALLPGMYLTREHIQAILADPSAQGPRGGRQITFENAGRYMSNTLFAELIRDGWIGTRAVASTKIAQIVREGLSADRAVVIARAGRVGASANPARTLAALEL